MRARVVAETVDELRRAVDHRLHRRVLAVEDAQRIRVQPAPRVVVERRSRCARSSAISSARCARRSSRSPIELICSAMPSARPERPPQPREHHHLLGVDVRAREAERFDVELVELPVAALLRALVPEHRPAGPHALRPLVDQVVLDRRAHDAGGAPRDAASGSRRSACPRTCTSPSRRCRCTRRCRARTAPSARRSARGCCGSRTARTRRARCPRSAPTARASSGSTSFMPRTACNVGRHGDSGRERGDVRRVAEVRTACRARPLTASALPSTARAAAPPTRAWRRIAAGVAHDWSACVRDSTTGASGSATLRRSRSRGAAAAARAEPSARSASRPCACRRPVGTGPSPVAGRVAHSSTPRACRRRTARELCRRRQWPQRESQPRHRALLGSDARAARPSPRASVAASALRAPASPRRRAAPQHRSGSSCTSRA